MLTTDIKAKGTIYEVVEPSYFQNAEYLSAEDEQGAIYDFLKEIGREDYTEWLSAHENDYYFAVVKVGNYYYAVAYEDYTRAAWAVEIEAVK